MKSNDIVNVIAWNDKKGAALLKRRLEIREATRCDGYIDARVLDETIILHYRDHDPGVARLMMVAPGKSGNLRSISGKISEQVDFPLGLRTSKGIFEGVEFTLCTRKPYSLEKVALLNLSLLDY